MQKDFILKGIFCHTPDRNAFQIRKNAFAVCTGGICAGIFDGIPERFQGLEIIDCTDCLIIPGMVDLHTHAPQFSFYGTGMDYELLEWLDQKTFPEEMRYSDLEYAGKAYHVFSRKLQKSATTRAVIFGTVHREATLLLADCMEKSGVISYVGKVNMDRNVPEGLKEPDAGHAAADTRLFLEEVKDRRYRHTKPVITPRFVPACSDELMKRLGGICAEFDLPVQSHLSENPEEILWVKDLEPEAAFYGDVYDRCGLFGRGIRTVMAHCVFSPEEEIQRIVDNGVWVAHCPSSNMNLASGIAPMRKYLDRGLRAGLGSDVAAGSSESIFRAVTDAIQVSKLYARYIDRDAKPLSFSESFYLATKGGGSFFGQVGSFEEGYEFDAVILDDSAEEAILPDDPLSRLERAFYLGLDQRGIRMKFAGGEEVEVLRHGTGHENMTGADGINDAVQS